MNQITSLISIHPEVRFGKPCIAGTRIAVGDILSWLASGMSQEQILEDYPALRLEHVHAALRFAADREAMIRIIAA
ncbi:MAG: DUF433 domain-containing protein [Proteobacteria bacterium]|nr:MAG: DUF433 domain-containing protein [Pseudomonadota bacterium]